MNDDLAAAARDTKLLVGVCGAVAALGTPHALLWARSRLGLTNVRVLMTSMAQRLVARASLEAASDRMVITGWDDLEPEAAPHVRLASWPDVILILPATANFIAKAAHGHAEDLLTTVVLAASCPVVLAPSMNPSMWSKPAVQRNVDQLRADGYTLIPPGKGLSLAADGAEHGSIEDVRQPILAALSQVISLQNAHSDLADTPDKAGRQP